VVYGYFALTFVTPLIRILYPDTQIFNAASAAIVVGIMIAYGTEGNRMQHLFFLLLFLASSMLEGESLTLFSPKGREVWVEGNVYSIRWRSELKDMTLCIEAAIGGHSRGILNNCATPIGEGKFLWKISRGFVSDFGNSEERHVRLMLWPKGRPELNILSPEFTIVTPPVH